MKTLVCFVRSVVFTSLMIITVLGYALGVTVTVPLRGRESGYRLAVGWARLVMRMLKSICGLDYRVTGMENVPESSAVIYIKHSSTWEAIAQIAIFPQQSWVLKKEIQWIPLVGSGVTVLNAIAIDRNAHRRAVQQVIQQGKERLARGLYVMIFPEGTRVRPGEKRRYGASGALLAAEAGVPLVPVSHNAGYFWPRRSWLKRPGTIDMVIGQPLSTAGKTAQEINEEARDWIESTLEQLPRPRY